jgi:predicted nucleic acid-binding Zn ribbon protein
MRLCRQIRWINGNPKKYCPVCKKWLPVNARYFSESRRHATGFLTYCKDCCNEIQRRKREKARAAEKGYLRTDAAAVMASAEILKPEYWLINSDSYRNGD